MPISKAALRTKRLYAHEAFGIGARRVRTRARSAQRCGSSRRTWCEPGPFRKRVAGYLLSAFHMSWIAFHEPSFCFFHTQRYLPFSETFMPSAPLKESSYVPTV